MGPFLEQKASVGFRKLRPRGGGAHAGSAPGLQALVRQGPHPKGKAPGGKSGLGRLEGGRDSPRHRAR